MADRVTLLHPFDAMYDDASKVLILGSFPSVVSREQAFYYANRTNRFWKVMAELFHEDINDRAAFCHEHHIALWDVIYSCSIEASYDSSIKDVKVNAIQELVDKTDIRIIMTTGKKAGSLYEKYVVCDKPHINLPSTSSANAAMHIEDLVKSYSVLLEYTNEEN